MSRFTFSINGILDIEPVSVDKVNKFYTTQNEFLRDTSVLTSKSRFAESLHLATFAFDLSKSDSVEEMCDLISICRSFPYMFIRCEAMGTSDLSMLGLSIGDGYFMYALHEYEIELGASDNMQGMAFVSLRLQTINWKPLAKTIKFISINQQSESENNSKSISPKSKKSGKYKTEYELNPGDSNLMKKLVDFYRRDVDNYKTQIINQGYNRDFDLYLGYPIVFTDAVKLHRELHDLCWGEARTFRILKKVDLAGTDAKDGQQTNANISEVKSDEEVRFDETGRINVGWKRELIGGTNSTKNKDNVAIQSINIRRRNRFANQTIQDFSYPYCQYLGHSPTEINISTVTNHEEGMDAASAAMAIDRVDEFTKNIRVTYPALKGLDVIAIENPIVNAMGVKYVIIDSSQSSTTGNMNNIITNNYSFVESDSTDFLENSKFVKASSKEAYNDILAQAETIKDLLAMANIESKKGANTSSLKDVLDKINKPIIKAIDEYKTYIDSAVKKAEDPTADIGLFLEPMLRSKKYKNMTDTEKSTMFIKEYLKAIKSHSATQSEERVLRERLRSFEQAVTRAYKDALGSSFNKYTIDALSKDLEKEKEYYKTHKSSTSFSGEAIPDMKYKEIFHDMPKTEEYSSYRDLPSLPFVYDQQIFDGEKIMAKWEQSSPLIDEILEDTNAMVNGPGSSTDRTNNFTKVNAVASSGTINPDGTVSAGSVDSVNGQLDAKTLKGAQLGVHGASGIWLKDLSSIMKYVRISSPFGMRRGGFHHGIDLAGPTGTPIYAASAGKVTVASNRGRGGNSVYIQHAGGITTWYMHLSAFAVKPGQPVIAGQLIGFCGSTGHSTGPHLHYQVNINGKPVDPAAFHNSINGVARQSNQQSVTPPDSIKKKSWLENLGASIAGTNGQSAIGLSITPAGSDKQKAKDGLALPKESAAMQSAVANGYQPFTDYNSYNLGKSGDLKGVAAASSAGFTSQKGTSLINSTLLRDYAGSIAAIESRGRLNPTGNESYLGMYQIGLDGLMDIGWIRKTAPRHKSSLYNDAYWTIPGGYKAFISSRELQDQAFVLYTQKNIDYLSAKPGWNKLTFQDKVLALAMSHNGGHSAGWKALQGKDSYDGNRTSRQQYGRVAMSLSAAVAKGTAGVGMFSRDAAGYTSNYYDNVAVQRNNEAVEFNTDPTPWDPELQGKARISNMVKDYTWGLEKLIPTYKVYLVHGNNENTLFKLINTSVEAVYYEISTVRNIRVEMANQDNPVAVAYFEVLNSLNTSTDPTTGYNTADKLGNTKLDITSLGSDFANVVAMDQIRLKAGNKVQIRMGYGNKIDDLPVIFNGLITETDGGDVVRVVAEGYGRELQNELIFAGDVLPFTTFASDTSGRYISAAIARIVKNARLQHFGANPKILGEDVDTNSTGTAAQGVSGQSGFSLSNSLWNSESGEFFFYDFKGPTDHLENFWLMNVDMVDRFFVTEWNDLFPFSLNDYFVNFPVLNKTVWDVITTGRRLFPSSVSLVKNIGARCTLFTGIKEQLMVGYETTHSVASEVFSNINGGLLDKEEQHAQEVEEVANATNIKGSLGIPVNTTNGIKKRQKETTAKFEVLRDNPGQVADAVSSVMDSRTIDPTAWVPVTNFHMFSSATNIISNQLRLNQDVITQANVEYGSDPGDFGTGKNKMFDMKTNGGLMPAFVKSSYLSDSTLNTEGMAIKTGQGYLLEELEKMYTGSVIISGNPDVAPGDYAYISDSLRQMSGVMKCREVQHILTEDDGYITIITPGMFVEPATHLYSSLYIKLGMFYSMLAQGQREYALVSVNSSPTGEMYSKLSIAPTNIGFWSVGWATAGSLASVAASGMLLKTAATRISAALWGPITGHIASGWARFSKVNFIVRGLSSMKGALGGVWARIVTAGRTISTAINAVRTVGIVSSIGSGGLIMAAGITIIVAAVVIAVWGILKNVWEANKERITMRHRALMKMPLTVYGQEYTAGLLGWNDELSPIELQVRNLKTTWENLAKVWGATKDTSASTKARILYSIATD